MAKGFECLAASAYAAKETRKAQLAAAKAISLAPEVERLTLKQEMEAAKTSPLVAQALLITPAHAWVTSVRSWAVSSIGRAGDS